MNNPHAIGSELGIDRREVKAAAQALGLGRWVNPKLFLLEDSEVETLRPILERMVTDRERRVSRKLRRPAEAAHSA